MPCGPADGKDVSLHQFTWFCNECCGFPRFLALTVAKEQGPCQSKAFGTQKIARKMVPHHRNYIDLIIETMDEVWGLWNVCVRYTFCRYPLETLDSCKLQDAYLASQGLMGLTAHLALDSPAAVLSPLVPVSFNTIIWLLCSCMVEVNMVKQTCTASRLPNARSIEDVLIILVFWLRTLV